MDIFATDYPYSNAAHIFAAIADKPYSLFFDSADQAHPDARYSYILCNPIETIEATGTEITISNHERFKTIHGDNPFDIVKDRLAHADLAKEQRKILPPFQGGAAGLFGYDLGRTLEILPDLTTNTSDAPDMAIGIYDQVLAFDHQDHKAWIITHASNEAEAKSKQAALRNDLTATPHKTAPQTAPLQWQAECEPATFKTRIAKAINAIKQGDIFQTNLAQKFEAILPPDFNPYAHYLTLRTINRAPLRRFFQHRIKHHRILITRTLPAC